MDVMRCFLGGILMESIKKGERLLFIVITTDLISEVFNWWYLVKYKDANIINGVIRVIVLITLFYLLYQGKKWAKILNIIIYGIHVLVGAITLISNLEIHIIFLLIIYSATVLVLLFARNVECFLRFQRGNIYINSLRMLKKF